MVLPPRSRTRERCRQLVAARSSRVAGLSAAVRDIRRDLEGLKASPQGIPLLRRKDICRRCSISVRTFHRWRKEGRIPEPVHFHGNLWRQADIEAAEAAGKLPKAKL